MSPSDHVGLKHLYYLLYQAFPRYLWNPFVQSVPLNLLNLFDQPDQYFLMLLLFRFYLFDLLHHLIHFDPWLLHDQLLLFRQFVHLCHDLL
jgi:hypothetical protein